MNWLNPPRGYKGPEGEPVKMTAANMVNPNPTSRPAGYPSQEAMDWLVAHSLFDPLARQVLLYVYGFE